MKLFCCLLLTFVATLGSLRSLCADEPAAVVIDPGTWELRPYRIELCVVVEPSARLPAQFENDLSRQLTAQTQAAQGGPWQVTANQKLADPRHRLLRELPVNDPPTAIEADKQIDKLIFVAIREQAGQFQITAREWDVVTRLWNVPITRTTAQPGRLAAEGLIAVLDAFGPLARIDAVAEGAVTLCLRAGALPRRDGTFLSVDRDAVFRPVLLQADKQGTPQPATAQVIPWTYLIPAALPTTSSSNLNRAVFKCSRPTALDGEMIPSYHPLQPRLAVGLARSIAPIRLQVVDADSPNLPLEGYEVRSRAAVLPVTAKLEPHGLTRRDGRLEIPAGDGGLRWVGILHGGEPLAVRPIVAGLHGELKIFVKSDRRRLELAAALVELNDDLLDFAGRLTILGTRVQAAVAKRDVTQIGRLSQETRALAANNPFPARVTELERQIAATDEGTRNRLAPALDQAKATLATLKAAQDKLP